VIEPAVPSRRLILFAGGVFAVESGFYAVIPPLIPRLVSEAHLTTTQVGLLVAVSTVLQVMVERIRNRLRCRSRAQIASWFTRQTAVSGHAPDLKLVEGALSETGSRS
jgi:hypothetical protein